MRFLHDSYKKEPLVELDIEPKPVFYIGPATRENPLSQIRTKLLGNVYFRDPKMKWNRITLHFIGTAGLDITAPSATLPADVVSATTDLQEAITSTTHLETTVTVCEVEKELIFNNQTVIDFGLHLPPYLPPTIRTEHSFVEYKLSVLCTGAGPFGKKFRVQKPVTVYRHYLPSPSSLIPSVEFGGVREWFEWFADVPKATAIEAGEVVIALRWSVEKELVDVDKIEVCLQELETYRFSTKSGVHNLTPIVTQFPSTEYIPPSFSNSSETHFVRTPIPLTPSKSIRTHHFDPFLEITHRIKIIIRFKSLSVTATPIVVEFPIIITDFPSDTTADYFTDPMSPSQSLSTLSTENSSIVSLHPPAGSVQPGGDEVPCIDLELPEYTPPYERNLIFES
ncbi:hypothetical protein BDF21DRAFT_406680 [Thamnidium elegans]|nr:hypothetical protein BDF21DRAFT_406680 [Thamnidium elegans]